MKAKRRTIFLGILCLSLFLLCFSSLTAFAEHGRDARTKGDRTSDRTSDRSDRKPHMESRTEHATSLEKAKSVSESPAPRVGGPETNEKQKNSQSKALEPDPAPVISKPKDLPGPAPKANSSGKNSGTESSTKRNSPATTPQAPEKPKDSKLKAPAEPQAPPAAKLSNPSGPDAAKVDPPKSSSSAKNSKNSMADDSDKKNSPLTTGAEVEDKAASEKGAIRSQKEDESEVSNHGNADGNSAQKDPKAKDSERKNSSKRNSIDKNSNKDSTATMLKDVDDSSLFKKAASLAAIIFAKDNEDNKKDAGDDGADIWVFTSKDKEDSSEKDDSDNDWKGRHKDECVDRPELTIKKSADPPSGSTVSPGDKITYTLNYENIGTGKATGVVISDRAPPGTTIVPGSVTGGGTVSEGVITWNIGTLSAGNSAKVSFAVTVDDDVSDGTVIVNKATIDSKETECIVSNKTKHFVEIPPFSIDKQGPDKASPGEEITYVIKFKNTSESDATGVVIKDTLPDHVTVTDAAGGTVSGNTITWVIGNLKAGKERTITFKVKIDDTMPKGTTILKNCAEISGELKKHDPSAKDCVETKVTVAPPVRNLTFSIDKKGPVTASPGEEITYVIDFKNTGDGDATGVVIKDTLPDHVTVTDAAGGTVSGNTITWVIGDLKAGKGGTITFKVKIDKSMPVGTTILKNCAEISGELEKVDPSAKDCVETSVTVLLLPPVGEEVPKPKAPPTEVPKAPPSIEVPTPISEAVPSQVAAPAAPLGLAAPLEIAQAEEEEVEEIEEVEEVEAALPFTGFNFSWLFIGFGMAILGAALRRKD